MGLQSMTWMGMSYLEIGGRARCLLLAFLGGCFKTGFLCVALAVLELALVDHAGSRLTEICVFLLPESWN